MLQIPLINLQTIIDKSKGVQQESKYVLDITIGSTR